MKSSRCPTDWTPDASVYAVGRKLGFSDAQVNDEMDMLRDHEFARPRCDWSATARNWLRNAAKYEARHVAVRNLPDRREVTDWRAARQGQGNLDAAFKGRFGMSYEAWAERVGR